MVTIGCIGVAAVALVDRSTGDAAADRSRAIAIALADSPAVAAALESPDPSAVLRPLAERVRSDTDVSFVVVMAPDRTRYSHPNPDQIGKSYIGTVEPALAGQIVTETYEGTLGPSTRSVVPVYADPMTKGGEIIGLVSVGITEDRIADAFRAEVPLVLGALVIIGALAVAGSWALAHRVRRQTFGLDPGQLAAIYEHHRAVLHTVREGLLVLDPRGHLVLANDEARALLDLPEEAEGSAVADLELDEELGRVLADQTPVVDAIYLAGERLVVVSQVRATIGDRDLGTVVTLRDQTELAAVSKELGTSRTLADSLQAHAHETANRLHTIAMLVELGEYGAAVELATSHASSAQALTDLLVGRVEDPVVVALLLGKGAEAQERSIELHVADDTMVPREAVDSDDLVTIIGNLIDNALDAASASSGPRRVEVEVRPDDGDLRIEVSDSGPGVSMGDEARIFTAGWSTKEPDPDAAVPRGVGLAVVKRVVDRRGGVITVRNDVGAVISVRLPLRGSAEPG
jgi:sensor histidine kinase regulating citrate/malate metabolism